VPKKGGHHLLPRLLSVVDRRLAFTEDVSRLKRQQQWLIELEHLLDPEVLPDQPRPTAQSVAEAVENYLNTLAAEGTTEAHPDDRAVIAHIEHTVRQRWWGLFVCYEVQGLPRTNNELETFLRRIKTGHRRVSGRKNVHDFIIRYGRYGAYVDPQESQDALLTRLRPVSHDDFLSERLDLVEGLQREQKRHRFRHHRAAYLKHLEARWAEAVAQAAA